MRIVLVVLDFWKFVVRLSLSVCVCVCVQRLKIVEDILRVQDSIRGQAARLKRSMFSVGRAKPPAPPVWAEESKVGGHTRIHAHTQTHLRPQIHTHGTRNTYACGHTQLHSHTHLIYTVVGHLLALLHELSRPILA